MFVNSIFCDPREQIEIKEADRSINKKAVKCPEIEMRIEGVLIRALIDTGSEITCISLKYYDFNPERLKKVSFNFYDLR